MTFRLTILLVSIIVVSCTETSSLSAIIERYDQYHEDQKDDDYPWPKVRETDISKQLTFYSEIKNDLDKIDPSTLDGQDLINFEMLVHIISNRIFNLEYESHLIPINSEGGFITGILYSTRNRHLRSEEDLEKYLKRLRSLPQYIDDRIDNLKKGLDADKKSSKFITSKFLDILSSQITSFKEQNLFTKVLSSYKGNFSEETTSEFSDLIGTQIPSSYEKLLNFINNQYLPNAYDKIGAVQLPDGKAYYEQRVKFFTTLDISPEEVFQKGQEEVARIRADMERIIEELEFKGSWDEFFEFLRTDPQFYQKTTKQLLMHASWICKEMEFEMPKYFGRMPRMPFSVKPVPASIAANYTAGRYSGGSYEDHRAGQYWVNTTKLESRPLYALPALSLHEAAPGHHTQGMLAQELEGLPKFRSNYLSAFGEGWGLYSEFLGIEAGIYKTPYEHFGRMTYEMWRACRLVVDVGMHYKGWNREKAFDFLASNTALSLHEVNTEIDRYIGWPAQAVSYKMGELKIRELRKKAEDALADNFDIRAFHDKVLENGSIPMRTLERIVNNFIEESLAKS